MSLRDVLERIRGREKTLTVYTSGRSAVVPELREYFASQNVTVEEADAGTEPGHAVVSDNGEFLAAVGIAALESLTRGSAREVGEDAAYGPLLACLDRTTFTSYSRRQMLEATREIEDRAWRTGSGRLYAGFQRLSEFADERETYRQLAATDLDVHVYGVPDVDVDVPEDVTFHGAAVPAVESMWFVVFDGGDEELQASALLAQERGEDFYGCWTYDTDLVDDAVDALDAPSCST